MAKAVISGLVRPLLEPHLPDAIDVTWILTPEEAEAAIVDADIAWVDMNDPRAMNRVISAGDKLKWVSTIYAGLDHFPVEKLASQGTVVTNGVGVSTLPVADYAVLGVLSLAKGYAEVVRASDRREWLTASPGTFELSDSKALVIGYGAIGSAIGERLKAFGVEVTGVARTARPDEGIIGPDDWQSRIAEFDWIVLATPSTSETQALLGAREIAAMKSESYIVNIARGSCIDQEAMIEALQANRIGGAFLDVTTPEPLPEDHVLWTLKNVQISMHLSGRSQRLMFDRSAGLFLRNADKFLAGEPMENTVDLSLGY